MSESFDKGRDFEREVAAIIRRKIDKGAKRDSKSGALWNRKRDIFTALPISIECKHHETIKIREFYRQAEAAASHGELPAAVFPIDGKPVATVPFDGLINLYVEIDQLRNEVADLREPISTSTVKKRALDGVARDETEKMVADATEKKVASGGFRTCRNGHIVSDGTKCMWKGCQYSRTYKKKKEKR